MKTHTHRALMTIAPTKARGEIKRGADFTPATTQEARDLEGAGMAELNKDAAAKGKPAPASVAALAADEGGK